MAEVDVSFTDVADMAVEMADNLDNDLRIWWGNSYASVPAFTSPEEPVEENSNMIIEPVLPPTEIYF